MKTDYNGEEISKAISCRLQIIDSARLMASSLSNLVDNLAEVIHKIKRTNCNMCYLEYSNAKDDLNTNVCVAIKIIKKSLMKRRRY